MEKICLVLEGGGNRGVYTAGVLDAFLDNKIDIPNVYGVSAGALNAISYLSKQKGRSLQISKDYFRSQECVDFKRVLRGKSIVNLDYLFSETAELIDLDEFHRNENFVVTCTNILTGAPVYKKIEDYNKDLDYIKASASLPLFSKVVEVDGLKLLDGGISDSIPVMQALNDGFDKIIVVLTRHKDFVCHPYKHMGVYKAKYHKYPNFIKTMENRYNKYNVTRDLIDNLEKDNKIIAIYPSQQLIVSHLEKNEKKIDDAYQLGYDDAIRLMDEIKQYIGVKVYEKTK